MRGLQRRHGWGLSSVLLIRLILLQLVTFCCWCFFKTRFNTQLSLLQRRIMQFRIPASLSRLLLLVTTVFWAPLKRFFKCYTSSAELGLLLCGFIKLLPDETSPDNSSFGSGPCRLLLSCESWSVFDRQLINCAELCLIFNEI